jgi:hypothetical protein
MWLLPVLIAFGFTGVQAEAYIALMEAKRTSEWNCMSEIFQAESSWDPAAVGDSGQSFGLPQRHAPAHGYPPSEWPVREQVAWSLAYADERYGGICQAAEVRRRRGWW